MSAGNFKQIGAAPFHIIGASVSLTLARTWGGEVDATPLESFPGCALQFLRQKPVFFFLHSLLLSPPAQGLKAASFYGLSLLSFDLVLKVMSRPS